MKLLISKWGLQSSNLGFRKNKPLLVRYKIWDAIDTEIALQQFLECWLLGLLRTFCNFFLKITLKFSVLMLKSQ